MSLMATYRKIPLVSGQIYHIFNRSIARQPILLSNRDYQRALNVLAFYSYFKPQLRFSHFKRLADSQKTELMDNLKKLGEMQIELYSFSFMPNHIHFLVKEIREKATSTFMSNFQNSYAKYFNTRNDRNGGLFQQMFKSVLIETDEQFIHVARYIHLNPVTAYILKNVDGLANYPWTSFSAYVGKHNLDFLNKEFLLSFFPSLDHFINFTKDQVDYQRRLDRIRHLLLE